MLKYIIKKKLGSVPLNVQVYCDYFHKFRQAGFLRHRVSMPLQDWSESLKYLFHCTTSPLPMHSYSTLPTWPYSPPFPISTPMSLVSSKISAMASEGSGSLLAYTWIWEKWSVGFRRTISGMLLEQTRFDWKIGGFQFNWSLPHIEIWLKCALCGCLIFPDTSSEFPV